ncbi:MAG: hypothetical protein K8H86_14715 [Ignavibacteriaceae bacterium]|nr:hypothetical protein [Ignavibacteriaceae bacterium]
MKTQKDKPVQNKIIVFESRKIRRTWYKDEWYFSVIDVCGALTDSPDADAYWRKLKQRLSKEGSEVVTICHGLKLEAADVKKYLTDCSKYRSQTNRKRISYLNIQKMRM